MEAVREENRRILALPNAPALLRHGEFRSDNEAMGPKESLAR